MENNEAVYDVRKLGTSKALILGVQHLFAMFGATVLVPALTGLNVSTTLLFAGLGTLLFHLVTGRKVPAFLGSSFAFLGGYAAIAPVLADGIGLVKISNFDERCASESIAAVQKLQQEGAKKIIFDVRNNPGGYAEELVKLLDYLLPEGDLFRSVSYDGTEKVDTSDADCLDMPMAVLINGSSYSAAEFFAAALQEYQAATIVGEPTVGKGVYQTTISLGDGSAVALSTGKYFTPKGNSLTDVGVIPDVRVDVDEETAEKIYYGTLGYADDLQIQAAIQVLNR